VVTKVTVKNKNSEYTQITALKKGLITLKLKLRNFLFYLLIFVNGFLFIGIAALNMNWFYSFGWILGTLAIGFYLAAFPVDSIHKWVGLFLQMFAMFIPVKFIFEFHKQGLFHVEKVETLHPLVLLGQLYLIIVAFAASFVLCYFLLKRLGNRKKVSHPAH
jgi:hypothetical protein